MLPVLLERAIAAGGVPYRLLATQANNQTSLLLIDLKPFRIRQVKVDLPDPKFLAATSWGYVVASVLGKMILLDMQGTVVGKIDGPKQISAIASFHTSGLMIATFEGCTGMSLDSGSQTIRSRLTILVFRGLCFTSVKKPGNSRYNFQVSWKNAFIIRFLTILLFMSYDWLMNSHLIMIGLLLGFAVAHSGLAAGRPRGEKLMGVRLYRVLFALVSLPLAMVLIVYFFNHHYDGWQLWQVQDVAGVRLLVWVLSALSFFFLYPATFNLLEIAALQKPQVHLYSTGIIRVTRHPQMVGQVIWCIAHTLWIGTTFTMVTSIGLVLHHIFGVWHGDRRLADRYGQVFETVKASTSIIPFLAIAQGRQTLEWQEFIRPAYFGVIAFIGLLWWAHPWLIIATSRVGF